jgi:hypothetical protein
MKSIINEFTDIRAMGTQIKDRGGNIINSRPEDPRRNPRAFKDLSPKCSSMYGWQKEIYSLLKSTNGVYVSASPGGGKTLPYTCYWIQEMLNIDVLGDINANEATMANYIQLVEQIITGNTQIQRLVITVPTRTLANQTYQEFSVFFGNFLAEIMISIVDAYYDPKPKKDIIVSVQLRILKLFSNHLGALLEERRLEKNRYDKTQYDEERKNIERRISNIDTLISEELKKSINRIITTNRVGNNDYSMLCRRTGEGAIGDHRQALVTIAIYDSAAKIISEIPNIGLIVFDEAHLSQNDPEVNDPRSKSIATALYTLLKNKATQRSKFCFLSGTVNPGSAKNLISYINNCFSKNIKLIQAPETARNQSEISVIGDDSLRDQNNIIKIIAGREKGNLIVIFSKRGIQDIAYQALKKIAPKSLDQIQKGNSDFSFGRYSKNPRRPSGPGNSPDIKREELIPGMKGAEKIYGELLRKCVKAGFGFIHRIDQSDSEHKEKKNDNAIVVDLFKAGKIKTILATDAVGIGVNITVRNLYIPDIFKFDGTKRSQLRPAQLAQLLHRTGRGQFIYGTIYTPEEYVDEVTTALTMAPTSFQKTAVIVNMDKRVCHQSDYFVNLWRNQIRKGR